LGVALGRNLERVLYKFSELMDIDT